MQMMPIMVIAIILVVLIMIRIFQGGTSSKKKQ